MSGEDGRPYVALRNVYTPHGFVAEIRTGKPGVNTEVVATVDCRKDARDRWTLTMPDGERIAGLTAERAAARMTRLVEALSREYLSWSWEGGDAEE
ncbi:MAG TPA: hypothetical protein VFL91_06390 [Thermomicrobiales bacterium]|nr:hypothetical protein [Thermomicrobiales bacterium]